MQARHLPTGGGFMVKTVSWVQEGAPPVIDTTLSLPPILAPLFRAIAVANDCEAVDWLDAVFVNT